MRRSRLLRLAFLCGVGLIAAACVPAGRSDFPAWLFDHPQRLSTELGTHNSDRPVIYSDGGGNLIVAWDSEPAGSSFPLLYWRRFNALGQPQTNPIALANSPFGDYSPALGMQDGITYLAWEAHGAYHPEILWGALNPSGQFVAGPLPLSVTTNETRYPVLVQCGGDSLVAWTAGTLNPVAFEIYFARVRPDGTVAVAHQQLTHHAKYLSNLRGQANADCSRLYLAYQLTYGSTDEDVYVLAVNPSDGSLAFGPTPLAGSSRNEEPFDFAVSSTAGGETLISAVWRDTGPTGGDIVYTSLHGDGTPCTVNTLVTSDMGIDNAPTLAAIDRSGGPAVMIFWQRVDNAVSAGYDIYLKQFTDNCAPAVPTNGTLVSNDPASAGLNDIDPRAAVRLSSAGIPAFAVIWRLESDGSIWARFGSTGGLVGSAELISDADSNAYPGDYFTIWDPPAVDMGQQFYVVWTGSAGGTREIWLQQTAWKVRLPLVTR